MFNINNILSEFKNITSEVAFTQEQEFSNGIDILDCKIEVAFQHSWKML